MSSPDSSIVRLPLPQSWMLIEGDPNTWGMDERYGESSQWLTAGRPLKVTTPLSGDLLLAPRNAGSLVVYQPNPETAGGWVPCETQLSTYLYLPSTTNLPAPGEASPMPGFELAANADIGTLNDRILTAMRDGTVLHVPISVDGAQGTVVLDGARLPFVIVATGKLAASSG